jgi:hypothetical protein
VAVLTERSPAAAAAAAAAAGESPPPLERIPGSSSPAATRQAPDRPLRPPLLQMDGHEHGDGHGNGDGDGGRGYYYEQTSTSRGDSEDDWDGDGDGDGDRDGDGDGDRPADLAAMMRASGHSSIDLPSIGSSFPNTPNPPAWAPRIAETPGDDADAAYGARGGDDGLSFDSGRQLSAAQPVGSGGGGGDISEGSRNGSSLASGRQLSATQPIRSGGGCVEGGESERELTHRAQVAGLTPHTKH